MLTAALNPFALFAPTRSADKVATGPERPKRHGPVFIHDAVIPWQGETLLLSLLRAEALDKIEQESGFAAQLDRASR
ncbi:MAG: hypothetical protein AB3N13_06290 [Arenibacterium sp.]